MKNCCYPVACEVSPSDELLMNKKSFEGFTDCFSTCKWDLDCGVSFENDNKELKLKQENICKSDQKACVRVNCNGKLTFSWSLETTNTDLWSACYLVICKKTTEVALTGGSGTVTVDVHDGDLFCVVLKCDKCKLNHCKCKCNCHCPPPVTGTACLTVTDLEFESSDCNIVRSTLCDALYHYPTTEVLNDNDKLLVQQCNDFDPVANLEVYNGYTSGWVFNPTLGHNLSLAGLTAGNVSLSVATQATESSGCWQATFTKNTCVSLSYTVNTLPTNGSFDILVNGETVISGPVNGPAGPNSPVSVQFNVPACQTLCFKVVNPADADAATSISIANFAVKKNECKMVSLATLCNHCNP
jgi:hypothetical protein